MRVCLELYLSATSMLMCQQVFGPVLAARAFQTEEEALQLANDSEFGEDS